MTVSLYDTRTLLSILEQMVPPKTFLLDTFFPNEETSITEYTDIDIMKGKRKLAPFIKPISQGQVVERLGSTVKSIKPPYIKVKMQFNSSDILKRVAGNTIYMGNSSPAQRAQQQLAKDLVYLQELILRRQEWMASKLLETGKIVLEDEYSGFEIDFGMDGTHLLSPGTEWDESASDPIKDMRDWCQIIAKDSGIVPNIAVIGSDIVAALYSNVNFQKQLNLLKVNVGEIKPRELPSGASYLGMLNVGGASLDLYCYNEWYDVAGTLYPMVPVKKIFLGSTQARTSRLYGAIQDVEFDGLASVKYFPKIWSEKDPSVTWLLLQSACVVCMHQVDAFGCATPIT